MLVPNTEIKGSIASELRTLMSTQPPLPAADSSNNQQQEENDDTTCVMAQGILSILGPIVLDIDKAIAATKQSQSDLGSEIDKLVKGKLEGGRRRAYYFCKEN